VPKLGFADAVLAENELTQKPSNAILMDMVHHNPGLPKTESKFLEPSFLKANGYIETEGLLVKTKNANEELEYQIKFEELGFDLIKKRVKTANIPFFALLLFDALYIGLLISAVIGHDPFRQQLYWLGSLLLFSILTIITYQNRNKDVVYLTGGQKVLELLLEKPDSKTVNEFIDSIHYAMRQHYKNKFLSFDSDTSFELRVNQLKWLKEIKALTEEEYKELLNATKTDNVIGFYRSN
ncbi:MAG: hypothetical protein EOP42_33345, partial [Sphingobacteriaceae bacterium]